MKQCSNGHIYDEIKHGECPYCSNIGSSVRPFAGESAGQPAFPKTMPLHQQTAAQPPEKPSVPKEQKKEMSPTVALNITDAGINPVRGWLVVIEGAKAGLSFVIHSEKNVIGRGAGFDVNLSFDKAASKEGDAIITYDVRKRLFYISPSVGKNNIYVNDSILLQPESIKDYDVIEIGETKFVFRSLCNEEFTY